MAIVIFCLVASTFRSSHEIYTEHCSVVEELSCRYPDAKVFLVGDYNLPDAVWSLEENEGSSSMIVDCNHVSPAINVCESFNSLSFYQVNTLPNNHGTFLDLLFSTEIINTEPCLDPILSNNFQHILFCFDIPVHTQLKQLAQDTLIYDFAKCNLPALMDFLGSADWSFFSSSDDIEALKLLFYENLNQGIEFYTPMKRVYHSSFPVWFSRELRSLIFLKKESHSPPCLQTVET